MQSPRGDMVQVHVLTSYPAVLLNRDDVGLAKRVPFGSAVRVRVSSQCLKKHWRDSGLFSDIDVSKAVRSRLIFERYVAAPLVAEGVPADEAAALAELVARGVLRQKAGKGEAADEDDGDDAGGEPAAAALRQLIVLSQPEVDHLLTLARELRAALGAAGVSATEAKRVEKLLASKEHRDWWREREAVLRALPASFDVAMFGRFITSDRLANVDAAVSVAHALTTHGEQAETDYFTAVDTLSDDSGAGHLNDTELTSGVFYLYAVIDMHQLRANLGPQAHLAEALARRLVRAIATVAPAAKRGSTAPFAFGEFVLVERGSAQPRTLANAFRDPVRTRGQDVEDLGRSSVGRLLAHRAALDGMYGDLARIDASAIATIHADALNGSGPPVSLGAALDAVLGAEAN